MLNVVNDQHTTVDFVRTCNVVASNVSQDVQTDRPGASADCASSQIHGTIDRTCDGAAAACRAQANCTNFSEELTTNCKVDVPVRGNYIGASASERHVSTTADFDSTDVGCETAAIINRQVVRAHNCDVTQVGCHDTFD